MEQNETQKGEKRNMGRDVQEIHEVTQEIELEESCRVIREAFATVAAEFGLTVQNNSTNPAFIGFDNLQAMQAKGVRLFGMYEGGEQIGFAAIEKNDDNLYYLEKLAVHPKHRHRGYGKGLIDFTVEYVRNNGGKKIGIGLIDENRVLKDWYYRYGFMETGTKHFQHLPFTVCLMELILE